MADSPAAPPAGQMRVIRVRGHVTEAYVTAADPITAKNAARALPPEAWLQRQVLQKDGEDTFEFDTVSSDDGA